MKSARQFAAGLEPFSDRILITCLLMVLFLPAHGFCQGKDHILVLHSYNKGLTWTDSEDAGIESVLRTRSLKIPEMTRFGITLADLPPGSTVLNQPVSFYQSHKGVVWGGIAGFAGFTLIIFLLLGFIRQRLHVEKKLVESENQISVG